jgi:aminotransferase
MINVFEPQITEDDIKAVNEILRSKWIGRGIMTKKLTSEFAKVIKTTESNVTITNSCTEAAFILAEYLRTKHYSRVYLPSMSFVGVANAFLANGYEVIFIDVSLESANIEIENIIQADIPKSSILVLNQYNNSSESIEEICRYCSSRGILLIEDAAGAMGAEIRNQAVGTFGNFGIWSLDAMKTVSAGDGGIIYSKDREDTLALSERIYLGLKSESGLKSASEHFDKWWEFDISGPFPRSILNDILASLAVSQLSRLNEKLMMRSELAQIYFNELQGLNNLSFLSKNMNATREGFYMMPVLAEGNRDYLANYLRKNNIYTTFRYFPLHTLSIYKNRVSLPNTDVLSSQILLLPLHEGLDTCDVQEISARVKEALT